MSPASTDGFAWDALEEREILPGWRARIAHSATMTFVLWAVDAGAVLPEHAHPHEQVIHLHEGAFELTVDGAARPAGQGQRRGGRRHRLGSVLPPHHISRRGRLAHDRRVA